MRTLRSLTEDCLRFTMHFFHLIQQYASHIHHSALPLSPKLEFHSRILSEKTKIIGFHGRPRAWGIVVRTIAASSRRFACMTTFGHRIAVACDDGTVDIYDSITGVLRLSLSSVAPVRAMSGSPDGSILFCAHQALSITSWDIQTGGLIHTLVLERDAEELAISLTGRYLACGSSNNSVRAWEVANQMEGAVMWTRSPATHFCWLEQEEYLAVSEGVSVDIWDIVAGTTLSSFTIPHPVHYMVYSQKLNRLAFTATFPDETAITIINHQHRIPIIPPTISHWIRQKFTCFAFSPATEEFVCGMETHGLQILHVFTERWRHVEYPHTMTSVSSLPNRTLAAEFAGSGVQLLDLDGEYTAFRQPTIPLTLHPFDHDQIIAILPTRRDRIVLLELATLSQLLAIPIQETHKTPTDRTHVLCASLDNNMAVYCFKDWDRAYLQLWKFNNIHPKWTAEIGEFPSIGGISPEGTRILTFHDIDNQTSICVWDTTSGRLRAQLRIDAIRPFDITFDSEEEFYSHHDTYSVPYVIDVFSSSAPASSGHSIDRCDPQPLIGGPRKRCYDVDDTYEWVVSGSKKVCWIPPGYIGLGQPSYWWVGHSLVMAGQDGTLRRLTFRE